MWKVILLVAIGGGAGSALRFLISYALNRYSQMSFPWSTFLVNIIGCFLLGILLGYFEKNSTHSDYRWLLVTGFCGGFTTFSAFALENLKLFQSGQWLISMMYIFISILLGIMMLGFGTWLMK